MNELLEELKEIVEMYESDLEVVKHQETKDYIKNCITDTKELIEKYESN